MNSGKIDVLKEKLSGYGVVHAVDNGSVLLVKIDDWDINASKTFDAIRVIIDVYGDQYPNIGRMLTDHGIFDAEFIK